MEDRNGGRKMRNYADGILGVISQVRKNTEVAEKIFGSDDLSMQYIKGCRDTLNYIERGINKDLSTEKGTEVER